MRFLPIVSRELRLASRRQATYWLRSGAALAIMIIGCWLFLLMKNETPKDLAKGLFCVLTGGAILFALLSGPRSTADCISEEKREGTLGLLFLTDLKGYDIVLGKLVAGSLNAFYSVVAVLPMMAIPLLLGGGVTVGEFGRTTLVILNALFLSLTVSICVSSLSSSAHKAAGVSSLLLVFFVAILPACAGLLSLTNKVNKAYLFLTPSVGYTYYLAFDIPYKTDKTWYWVSLATIHGVAWICLIVASVVAPRSWQERPSSQKKERWRERWQSWRYGSPGTRATLRKRLLDHNPIFWLVARVRSKPATVWFFLILVAAVWVWGWWKFRREWLNEGVYVGTALVVNIALRYWFATESARALFESRKAGALELLLSTPLTTREILHGHYLALRRQFLGPLLAALGVEFMFMLAIMRDAVPDEERIFWLALWLAGMVMLVADLVALYWVGLWQGLTSRNSLRAAGGTLARILILPWIVYGLVLSLMALIDLGQRAYQSGPTWRFFLAAWFGLGLGADVFFASRARQKLSSEFRLAAQEQYAAGGGFWRKWLSSLKPHVSGEPAVHLDPGARF